MFSLLRAPYFQYYDYFLSEYTCKREKGVFCLKIILTRILFLIIVTMLICCFLMYTFLSLFVEMEVETSNQSSTGVHIVAVPGSFVGGAMFVLLIGLIVVFIRRQ